MGKTITGNTGPTLGIETSADMYNKLKFESARLQKTGWNSAYDTFNFIVTAWHLYNDWTKSKDSSSLSKSKRNPNKLPESMLLVLSSVKDLCNGSKHLTLTPEAARKRQVNEVHTGEIQSWLAWFTQERIPGISVDVNWYFSIRVLHNIVMHYFEWVFDDEKPLKSFPPELSEAIIHCNLSQRNGKALSMSAKEILGKVILEPTKSDTD